MKQRCNRRPAAIGLTLAIGAIAALVAGGTHVHADHGAADCWVCMAAFGTAAVIVTVAVGALIWTLLEILPSVRLRALRFELPLRLASRSPPV